MSDILNRVKRYCTDLLSKGKCSRLPFHNLIHTQEVVESVYEITKKVSLSAEDMENVLIAAWFHDTGFRVEYFNHETYSKEIAKSFLDEQSFDARSIKTILGCIEKTRLDSNPVSLLEKIIADADLNHLNKCDYFYRNILLRKEWGNKLGRYYTDKEWYQMNLKFLSEHTFYLQTSVEELDINIGRLQNLLNLNL